jgi:hypothetical protein
MKRPPKNGEEQDAFTPWRHYLYWKPGQRKAIKRRANRRERQAAKREARDNGR